MQSHAARVRLAALPLALLLFGAAPAPRVIPHPEADGEALIIPHDSPVKFRGWDKYGYAKFDGQFVLTGTFTYGCWSTCADYDGPLEEADLDVRVEPDPALKARLPYWKVRKDDIMIVIDGKKRLAQSIASSGQHAALRSGKIKSLRGRTSVVVDDFRTGIECDTANFRARFVSIAKAPKLARVEFTGDYGCV